MKLYLASDLLYPSSQKWAELACALPHVCGRRYCVIPACQLVGIHYRFELCEEARFPPPWQAKMCVAGMGEAVFALAGHDEVVSDGGQPEASFPDRSTVHP